MFMFILCAMAAVILLKIGWFFLKLTAGAAGLVLSVMLLPFLIVGFIVTGLLSLVVPVMVLALVVAVLSGVLKGSLS